MDKIPSLLPYKTFNCFLHDKKEFSIYQWNKEDNDISSRSVLIMHDLWEDLTFYEKDINWFLSQNYTVYGINSIYNGSEQNHPYADNFDSLCINLLQVLSTIYKLHDLKPCIVYTKGTGALVTLKLARQYQKYIKSMICYMPMIALQKYPKELYMMFLKLCSTLFPNVILPAFISAHVTEFLDKKVDKISSYDKKSDSQHFSNQVRRIAVKALYDYLISIKNAKTICSHNFLKCLFLYKKQSSILNYDSVKELAYHHANLVDFSLQDFEKDKNILSFQMTNHDFDIFAKKYIKPWIDEFDKQKRA